MNNNKVVNEGGGGGGGRLYPGMMENPQFRWAFIRKVYIIISIQMLLTAGIAAMVVFVRPIPEFLKKWPGLAVYIVIAISPLLILCPLYAYQKKHPLNLFLLGLFTVFMAFAVGMACSFTKGSIILMAAILTSVVVVSLTLYTFWAVRRGKDFSFLGPFLFSATLVLLAFALIQFCFPLGKFSLMIYSGLAAIVFSAYIVYDTDNLIKRFDYDDYVWAAVSLYLDVVNLFLALVGLGRAAG